MPLMNAHGTLIKKGDGATPEVFTPVARLKGLKPPKLSRQTFESLIQNTSDDEYIVGIRRKGAMTATVEYDSSDPSHDETDGLIAEYQNGTLSNYQVVFTDGSKWSFAAYVTGFEADVPVEGIVTAQIEWQPSGAITFA